MKWKHVMQFIKHKKKFITGFIIAVILILILLYCFNESVKEIINLIIISFILSYVLIPINKLIAEKFKINNSLSSIFLILLIVGIFLTCIIMMIPALLEEIKNIEKIINSITLFFENLIIKFNLQNFPITNVLYNQALEKIDVFMMGLSENAFDNIIKISNNIVSLAVLPIIIYYFLSDGNHIYNKLLLIIPNKKRNLIKKILNDIDKVLTRYISGQLLLSGLVGVLTFISLIIFKVKFPIWISILNALLNIIPYFGPFFGAIPAIVVAFLDSSSKGISVTIAMFIIQQIEGNIFSPKITGDSTDMHPVVIIILLLIGDKMGGFLGMLLIVPIAVIIKVLYDDINYYLF